MNKPEFKIGILLFFCMVLVFVLARGGYWPDNWKDFFAGISISVIASVVSLYFIQTRDRVIIRVEEDLEKYFAKSDTIKKSLIQALNHINTSEFNRIDRNVDMGADYWVDLISDIDKSKETVWFIGNQQGLWIESNAYKLPLKLKITNRIKHAIQYKNSINSSNEYKLNILLSDQAYCDKWAEFIDFIIDDIVSTNNGIKKSEVNELLKSKINIKNISDDKLKYSLVKCGKKINIAMRTNKGRSQDSPTIDLSLETLVGQYFLDDLDFLARQYNIE